MPLLFLFLTLLFWHALADYPLQGQWLGQAKRIGGSPVCPWQLALLTHAYIHAFGVLIITGNLWAGLIELVAHITIDHLKANRKLFGHVTDQLLHTATKLVIVLLLWVLAHVQILPAPPAVVGSVPGK